MVMEFFSLFMDFDLLAIDQNVNCDYGWAVGYFSYWNTIIFFPEVLYFYRNKN